MARWVSGALRTLAWSFGPMILRTIDYSDEKMQVQQIVSDMAVTPASTLGVADDQFYKDVMAKFFSDAAAIRKVIKSKRRGYIAHPMLLSMALLTGEQALAMNQAHINALPDYLAQAEEATASPFAGRRVSLITDSDIITDTSISNMIVGGFTGSPDPTHLAGFSRVRQEASDFTSHVVRSQDDLDRALIESRDADIVLILGHGYPGNMDIGGGPIADRIHLLPRGVLRPGAILVFISCSFGEGDTWIRFADHVMGDEGVAVASPNVLSFHQSIDTSTPEGTEASNRLLAMQGVSTGLSIVTLPMTNPLHHLANLALFVQTDTSTHGDGMTPGIRLHNVATGETVYLPAH